MTKLRDLPLRYAILTAALVAVAHTYALFGRGVRSAAMDNMHLYALLLGFVVFCILALFERACKADFTKLRLYRLFFNLYNTGLASVLCGKMLIGILEVAGGSSRYTDWFITAGYGLCALAMAILLVNLLPHLKKRL